jgi:CheY-like chemotaxis protein
MSESGELLRLRPIFEGLTVLVVDDDVACRDAFTDMLEELGAAVLVASDGIEALAVLRQGAPDLVLSDIMMPRLDGYALMRQVRKDPALSGLPMIAVSAFFPAADQPMVGHSGVDGTLSKPFDYRDLDRALQRVMLKRPELFKRQRGRLRARATAQRAHACELRAKFRLPYESVVRRRSTSPSRQAARLGIILPPA